MENDVFALNKSENRNLPLPDQLAEVKKQISDLKELEGELIAKAKEAGEELGAFYKTEIRTVKQNRLNQKKLKVKYGSELDAFYEATEYLAVYVRELHEE
jgi:predicted phage-related endonuclease